MAVDDKLFKREPGIYCFINKINGKRYIGKSKNVYKRLNCHISTLNRNKSSSKTLQKAWNKYGEESFNILILEYCSENDLNEKECFYIDFFKTKENGYNLTFGGEGTVGHKYTDEQRCKLSKMRKGKKLSEYHKSRIAFGKLGNKNPNFEGRATTKESIEKRLLKIVGKKRPKQSNILQGKHRSDSKNYIGVYKKEYKTGTRWQAQTTKNNKTIYIGSYDTEKDAAIAYNNAVKELFENPKLNIIESGDD